MITEEVLMGKSCQIQGDKSSDHFEQISFKTNRTLIEPIRVKKYSNFFHFRIIVVVRFSQGEVMLLIESHL